MSLLVSSGCNLTIDTDSYDYSPVTEIGEQRLVITEVLAWTSTKGPGSEDERGEFIEVKNVGTAPADPKTITIEVRADQNGDPIQTISVAPPNTPAAIAAVNSITPLNPGEYFVFIRYETPETPISSLLDPGTYYDYGAHGNRVELSQSDPRFLELVYFDSNDQIVTNFDSLHWDGAVFEPEQSGDSIEMQEDRSLSLDANAEDAEQNDYGSSWCVESSPVALNGVAATPGQPSSCASR